MSEERSLELQMAMSIVITKYPFLAVLLLTLHKVVETRSVKTAATDQRTLFFNPDWIAKLTPEELAFVIGHEVLHTMMNHVLRMTHYQQLGYDMNLKPFNDRKWNQASDYVVNPMLIEMGLKAMPVGGLLNPQFPVGMLVDEVYEQMPDPPEGDNGGDKQDDGAGGDGGHGGFDEHLPAAQDAPTEADVAVAVQQAYNHQKAVGNVPACLQRLVDSILAPTKNWKDELRDLLRLTLGSDEMSWARPHRRKLSINSLIPHDMPFFPGTTGHGMGGVVIGIDTSGSVGEDELKQFLGETAGILNDCRPEYIKVLWVDTRVAGVDEPDNAADLVTLTPKGGGGTYMPAIFDWIDAEQLRPDVCIVLTDGYTAFGDAQPYPVVWGITTEGITADHGRSLHIDL